MNRIESENLVNTRDFSKTASWYNLIYSNKFSSFKIHQHKTPKVYKKTHVYHIPSMPKDVHQDKGFLGTRYPCGGDDVELHGSDRLYDLKQINKILLLTVLLYLFTYTCTRTRWHTNAHKKASIVGL